MHRNPLIIILELVAVVMLCCSCDDKIAYNNYESVSVEGWERREPVTFDNIVVKAEGDYQEEIGLRINDAYPYLSIFLAIEQEVRPGPFVKMDTMTCWLMDREGKIEGKGLSFYQYHFPLTTLHLKVGDTLNIRVRHSMRREVMPGIANVGMKITKQ